MAQTPPPADSLAMRLQKISERLNALRVIQEPEPSSRLPVLGPLLNAMRRLANRLATRWYAAPQIEQQARFSQEITTAFDELAAVLVRHEQSWAEHDHKPAESQQLAGSQSVPRLAVVGVALDCRPGGLVLDLAGGSGWASEFLSRFHIRTILLDYEEGLLRTSRARMGLDRRLETCAPNCPVVGDALRLPFADGSFDGVICKLAMLCGCHLRMALLTASSA